MKNLDYFLLLFSYVFSVIVSIDSSFQSVTNPGPSDYLVSGLGVLFAVFLFSSVFTLPIQFATGWDKNKYFRKMTPCVYC
jgi:hypothetical protein